MPGLIGVGRVGRHGSSRGTPPLFSLFANGEDGFLFGNWSELDELFTTSTGPIAVAADADPVGLALDDRSWGVRTLAQILGAQSNVAASGYIMSVNGGTGSAVESPSGTLNLAGDGAKPATASKSIATVVGQTYRVVATMASNASACFIGTTQGGAEVANLSPSAVGLNVFQFTATATTSWLTFQKTGATPSVISAIEVRLIPGNHALQATTTQRPLWRANSGKPYFSFDGSDDIIKTPFNPTSAMTMAAAVRVNASAADQYVMGGGETATVARAYLGVQGTTNFARAVWGSTSLFGAADITGSDHVLLATGNASTVSLWVDGVKVATATPTGAPGGATGAIGLGGINQNGTPSTWFAGRASAFLAVNRVVTDAEIGLITREMTKTYV